MNNFYSSLKSKIIKTVIEKKMPDESCRMCGGELAKCTVCAECRKQVSMICVQCGGRTQEQVHYSCFIFGRGKTNQNLSLESSLSLKQVLVA
jgi:hypothetical protein